MWEARRWSIIVEIAEACWGEAKLFKLDGEDPASFQPVELRLLVAANASRLDCSGLGDVWVTGATWFRRSCCNRDDFAINPIRFDHSKPRKNERTAKCTRHALLCAVAKNYCQIYCDFAGVHQFLATSSCTRVGSFICCEFLCSQSRTCQGEVRVTGVQVRVRVG